MRLLCKVAYRGTNYQGWQKQKDAPSVQEEIEKVLSQILNTEINIQGSGRTDAGVHAKGQYFHFDTDSTMDLERLRYSANCLLPKDISIYEISKVSDDFHARYSAKSKRYSYYLRFEGKNPFAFDLETLYPSQIDTNLLIESIKLFEGCHNFQDFTSKEEDEENFIRTIYSVKAHFIPGTNQFIITFEGNGFMRYMIRDMVGTSLAVASGKEKKDYISYHLSEKGKREIVPYKAPAEGLYLIDVNY